DPKPLAGDPAFAPSPILRSFELGEERADLLHRLDYLTERLSLDRQRVIGWAIAQGVAWSFGSNHREKHLQSVSWLIEAM
ncbi:MAG: aminoglycoside phosphotransferase, partial [Pseudomonadota bacterium]